MNMKELIAKLQRFSSRYVEKSILPNPQGQSIISFGFDDCPRSAIETALPLLEAEGWRATIYVACGLCETNNHLGLHMSEADIVDVHRRGHEIADHTFSHISTKDASRADYLADSQRNQARLKALGLPPSRHFAFPYGDVSPAIKRSLRGQFQTLRGVLSSDSLDQDANLLPAIRLYHGADIDDAIARIQAAADTPQWLNLFSHDIRDTPSAFGCTADDLRRIINAVRESGARVMTVDAAYQTLKSQGKSA